MEARGAMNEERKTGRQGLGLATPMDRRELLRVGMAGIGAWTRVMGSAMLN